MVKLLLSWDIKTDKEQEYFEFVVREFVPGLTKLGIQPIDAWYTLYGDCSQILTAGVTEDSSTMFDILESDGWHTLEDKLLVIFQDLVDSK